jgi:hypothetical protein
LIAEPAAASAGDNQLCRLVLSADSRIPSRGFIDVRALAAATLEQLDQLVARRDPEAGANRLAG